MKYKYIPNLLIGSLCVLIVIYLIARQITDSILWYDEAGQFFISCGLNHYSEPLSDIGGGIQKVLKNNSLYNMDPGGFSFILHFWKEVSTNIVWLRCLPLLFFLLYLVCIYKVIQHCCNISFYAILGVVLNVLPVFLLPTRLAVELRPYTMEMLGVSLSLFILLDKKRLLHPKPLFLFSVLLCIFCMSRYSFVITAFAVSLYVLYVNIKHGINKGTLINLLVYGLPLALTVLLIYIFMMSRQNPDGNPLTYVPYIRTKPSLLWSPLSLSFYAVWILHLFFRSKVNEEIRTMTVLTLIVSSVFFILSIMGFYPWHETKNISMTVLLYNTIVVYSFVVVMRYSHAPFLCVFFCLFWFVGNRVDLHRFNVDKQFVDELEVVLKQEKAGVIFIDSWLSPDIKYLCEFGYLKSYARKWNYPEGFVFQKGLSHSSKYGGIASDSDRKIKSASAYKCNLYLINDYKLPEDISRFERYKHYRYLYTLKDVR